MRSTQILAAIVVSCSFIGCVYGDKGKAKRVETETMSPDGTTTVRTTEEEYDRKGYGYPPVSGKADPSYGGYGHGSYQRVPMTRGRAPWNDVAPEWKYIRPVKLTGKPYLFAIMNIHTGQRRNVSHEELDTVYPLTNPGAIPPPP